MKKFVMALDDSSFRMWWKKSNSNNQSSSTTMLTPRSSVRFRFILVLLGLNAFLLVQGHEEQQQKEEISSAAAYQQSKEEQNVVLKKIEQDSQEDGCLDEGPVNNDESSKTCKSTTNPKNNMSLLEKYIQQECGNDAGGTTKNDDNDSTMTCILEALANPNFHFVRDYWEQKPLVLHTNLKKSHHGDYFLHWDDLITLADQGLHWGGAGGGANGVMVPSVKNGDTSTFDLNFNGDDSGRKATSSEQLDGLGHRIGLEELEQLTTNSTLLIGTMHAIHKGVSDVVLKFQTILGIAASANCYATKVGFAKSAPLHTDRLDSFIIQTSGSKRWKVYQPLIEKPVWGIHGNGEWSKGPNDALTLDMVGDLLVDTLLTPGDILYVPRGFPHATSTIVGKDVDDDNPKNDHKGENVVDNLHRPPQPSVALTVGLHFSESMHLVYEKVLRCAMSRAGYCTAQPPSVPCPIGPVITRYVRTKEGEDLRRGLPLGFLLRNYTKDGGRQEEKQTFCQLVTNHIMTHVPHILEHGAGVLSSSDESSLEDIQIQVAKTAAWIYDFTRQALKELEKGFAGNNGRVPYPYRQSEWQFIIGEPGPFEGTFCHEGLGDAPFMDYFMPELEADEFNSKFFGATSNFPNF